jgi:predicted DNA-binding protein
MKKNKIKQANYRLPETLIEDVKELSEKTGTSQTQIVVDGIQLRVKTLKARLARREQAAATA